MDPTAALMGRDAELAIIGRLAADVGERGSCLVVRGEPGIGKSMLLDAVAERLSAAGWRVLRTGGNPVEQRLPLSGLHKLLRPVMPDLKRLPSPQQDALRRGFGLVDMPAPGVFLMALAALGLLAEAATDSPVLVLVEDTHWLDRSSADVLGFIARRLESEPILMLASGRDVEDALSGLGLPELPLGSLDDAVASALIAVTGARLSPARRRAVLAMSAGNPLALVELPKALLDVHYDADLGGQLPMTTRLERAFAARVEELSVTARRVLLLAALHDSDSLEEVLRAAGLDGPDVGREDLEEITSADLMHVQDRRFWFRHPLVRSAVHQSATLTCRHTAHKALAAVLAAEPDRSVWHRAACVLGADEEVAAELDEAAVRAMRRSALDTAVGALRRSAQLSATAEQRGRRLLRAADLTFEQGDIDFSLRLARDADALTLEPAGRLQLEWIREQADQQMVGGAGRVDELLSLCIWAQAEGEADLALQFLRRAAYRCWTTGLDADAEARVITAIEQIKGDELDPRQIVIRAYAAPLTKGADVIERLDRAGAGDRADSAELHLLGHAAACVGAFDRAESFCAAAADGLRDGGRLAQLVQALRLQAWAALRRGRWDAASAAADECARLALETRQPLPWADALSAQAMLAGLRGDHETAGRLADEAESVALPAGSGVTLAIIQNSRAMTAAGRGRPGDAFEHLRRIYEPTDPAHHRMQACWAIGSLAEYAVRSARGPEARAELTRLEPLTALTPAAGVHVGMRYARALLADPADAEALYCSALDATLGDWPFEHARVLLAYGEWLRRRQRITESREPLRVARETFDRLGALGWAERARAELSAGGETSSRRGPDAWDDLTPQETQIARMVADGLSNKEIAQRLYLSHRTIASHLYRMFPKLGISSRAQLIHAASAHDGRPSQH